MNNKYPQIVYIYNRYKKASEEVKASVEIRVTHEGKQKYISTGIKLFPNQWKKGAVVNCPEALHLNSVLDNQLQEIRGIILEMANEGNIDISQIQERLDKKQEVNTTFLEFCSQRALVRKYGKTKDSQLRYDRFIKYFKQWGLIKEFEDITEANIIAYDKFLKKKKLKNSSKWNNYHRFLNSFIIDAIDAGFIRKNPYKWVNLERRRFDSINKCLTPEEFGQLKRAKTPTESLERVRDLFIFQTYTCLSYSDLKAFNPKKIQEIKGMKVYVGKRKKTENPYTIPLLSPAIDILNKYNGKLPIISNVKYNAYLKVVAQAAGIDKPLSTHWARHTGATLLLNEGVDMRIVSRICGHSSTRITEQIYAKLLDETVVEAIESVKDNI